MRGEGGEVSRGGGALRFEWVPTAKRPRGAEAVNAKMRSTSSFFFFFFFLFFSEHTQVTPGLPMLQYGF